VNKPVHAGFMLLVAACLIIAIGFGEAGESNNDWWD
jgi:hypothetical protein